MTVPVDQPVVIERRFRGPNTTAHGGYACGRVGVLVDSEVASVSLRLPPPLERPLEVSRHDEGVTLLDGDAVVAEGEPAELSLDPPEPVPPDEAKTAGETNPWVDEHPFPECFGCGTHRDRSEAIATTLGQVPGRDILADYWIPAADLADEGGHVNKLFSWAALDCPTGGTAIEPDTGPAVLAKLTANPVIAPIKAGEPHSVIAWLIERDGRKSRGGAAVYSADGTLCSMAEGLWIKLKDPAAFDAAV